MAEGVIDASMKFFAALVSEQGEEVCTLRVKAGEAGARPGAERIYRFRDQFWHWSSERGILDVAGPSLAEIEEAMRESAGDPTAILDPRV